ncbi:MAG: hypothetical protein H8E66_33385 [Planctomycetes bacterium]|nr:hypothetical protein [Planctomycetota bacterium]
MTLCVLSLTSVLVCPFAVGAPPLVPPVPGEPSQPQSDLEMIDYLPLQIPTKSSKGDSPTNGSGVEYILSAFVLVFGVCILGFVFYVIYERHDEWDDASFKAMTVPLVIFAGLFLVTAGYDRDQMAPMFGLLGTLIGYVLGQNAAGKEKVEEPDEEEEE